MIYLQSTYGICTVQSTLKMRGFILQRERCSVNECGNQCTVWIHLVWR